MRFWDSKPDEHLFYLSRSSWSILSICLFKLKKLNEKSINLFLPEYYCNDPIPLINHKNIKIKYYEIDEQFQPNFKSIKKISERVTPDIFLGVHYLSLIHI